MENIDPKLFQPRQSVERWFPYALCFSALVLLFVTPVAGLSSYTACPSFLTPKSQSCPAAALATPNPYSAGFIPIIGNDICVQPPTNGSLVISDTKATDGCDEICILAETCCDGWQAKPNTNVKLASGNTVACSLVNCANVCRMACDRDTKATYGDTLAPCSSSCSSITSNGKAYVFVRPGVCDLPAGTVNVACPTHVGFGFEVSSDVFIFGSLENGPKSASTAYGSTVLDNYDNGFWMTNGTEAMMLATFTNPWASCFHGTLEVSPYVEYKTTTVESPSVCVAVSEAESYYGKGYFVVANNCLNAVYNILQAYGVQFTGAAAGPTDWCPGTWYDHLAAPDWSEPQALPTSGTPAKATFCSKTSILSACSG